MSSGPHRPPQQGEPEEPRVVVRDKRRMNPDGSVREGTAAPAEPGQPTAAPAGDPQVAELTETLQRLKAEYDNYRRRAERERLALVEVATGNALAALLPVLDDLDRARAHGDLTGAFGSVADALIATTTKLGLTRYAEAGEPFDPQVHEAVMTAEPRPDIDAAVVAEVFRTGYTHAGRVLRPAQVSVSEPAAPQEA